MHARGHLLGNILSSQLLPLHPQLSFPVSGLAPGRCFLKMAEKAEEEEEEEAEAEKARAVKFKTKKYQVRLKK